MGDLKVHLIRMHSTSRPFPCRVPDCNKSFASLSELKRHLVAQDHPDLFQLVLSADEGQ